MKVFTRLGLTIGLLVIGGCDSGEKPEQSQQDNELTGKKYIVTTEPADSVPVGKARQSAKNGSDIKLLGRIGGSSKPFVDGLAAFTIVDPKVAFCPPEEGCPTPWDYCCTQDEVKENIATIKIVNDKNKPVAEDARKLVGVKELDLVIVQGTVKRDEHGNLSVLANNIYIKNESKD